MNFKIELSMRFDGLRMESSKVEQGERLCDQNMCVQQKLLAIPLLFSPQLIVLLRLNSVGLIMIKCHCFIGEAELQKEEADLYEEAVELEAQEDGLQEDELQRDGPRLLQSGTMKY